MTSSEQPTQRRTMRVLSLSNPWPWVMLHPDPAIQKLIENRSWAPPLPVIGTWIAMHAAKSWDKDAMNYWNRVGVKDYPMRKDLYPSGCIVGAMFLDRVRTGSNADLPADIPATQRKWFFGEYGWVLSRAIRLPTPIAHTGGQGLRFLPQDKHDAVLQQLAPLIKRAA